MLDGKSAGRGLHTNRRISSYLPFTPSRYWLYWGHIHYMRLVYCLHTLEKYTCLQYFGTKFILENSKKGCIIPLGIRRNELADMAAKTSLKHPPSLLGITPHQIRYL